MTDARVLLLEAIVELARELPPATLGALARNLESSGEPLDWEHLVRCAATSTIRERLRSLEELHQGTPDVGGQALSFALLASARAARLVAAEHSMEIAWTGPGTESVPLRRVDQVVYDLVESAKSDVLLVTYAAYKTDRALRVLRDATERGVCVRLVIELAHESGGKIAFDGLKVIRAHVPQADVFYWALERRTRDASNSYGAMHAKGLVADRIRALVSSANLTDHALDANMELGLIVEGPIAARLAAHFDQLILRGELIPAP